MAIHAVIFAFFAFVVVKLLGYALAGSMLNKAFEQQASPWKIGFARTAIGIAGALAFTALWSLIVGFEDFQPWHRVAWLLGLSVTRIIEWKITFSLFYTTPRRSFATAVMGTVWSQILDTPAWIAFRLIIGWWAITEWYAII
ncbi:hypothetical protein HY251_05160 [bacterium]|nr:hypothetical protein [bacterium]